MILTQLAMQGLRAGATPIPLLTLSPQGIPPMRGTRHLADQAGSIRLSTEACHVPIDTEVMELPIWIPKHTLPFLPYLLTVPIVDFRFEPLDRRIEIAATQVDILAEPHFMEALGSPGQVTYRLDLWVPRTSMQDVIPLMAGVAEVDIRGVASAQVLRIKLTDGTPRSTIPFPPGKFTVLDVPDAPLDIIGGLSRTVIFGQPPNRLRCVPIDRKGRRFYVCDPPMTAPPERVYRGGEAVSGGVKVDTAMTPTGWSFTQVTFERPIGETTTGFSNDVAVSGGMGIVGKNAITAIAEYGGIEIDTMARAEIQRFKNDFPLALLVNESSDPWTIIRDRLIPQTDCVATLHLDRLSILPIFGPQTLHFRLGANLYYRLPEFVDQPEPNVANMIELHCGLDHYGSTTSKAMPLSTILRGPSNGPAAMRSIARQSVARYGPRLLPPLEGLDLAVTLDGRNNPYSPGGERLADTILQLMAFAPSVYGYRSSWVDGLSAWITGRGLLYDDDESLDGRAVRIVRQTIGPAGVDLYLATEGA